MFHFQQNPDSVMFIFDDCGELVPCLNLSLRRSFFIVLIGNREKTANIHTFFLLHRK